MPRQAMRLKPSFGGSNVGEELCGWYSSVRKSHNMVLPTKTLNIYATNILLVNACVGLCPL